jgi:exodeoxyribonuclease VII large subunit
MRRDRVWSVGALIDQVNALLESGFSGITVEGEVTGATLSARGHLYFSLKEGDAQLDCVAWASAARKLRFDLEDGLAVLATGNLTIYRGRGRFQMVVSRIEPQGLGALQLAFEQMKRRLEAEGLFASERKRPLPMVPQRVGIVTSATGAALRDMLKVLRRNSNIEVIVAPATVQGKGASQEIAESLNHLGATDMVDVVIVARGGGSMEDLWAFNEEVVARAIVDCPIPVLTGVGHEVDFTIADFVADIRAATPTQAAEFVVTRLEESRERVEDAGFRLSLELRRHLQDARARLLAARGSAGLARVPHRLELVRLRMKAADRLPMLLEELADDRRHRLLRAEGALRRLPALIAAGGHRRLVESRAEQLVTLIHRAVDRAGVAVASRERSLLHLSPRRVLERGYSITTVEGQAKPLKNAAGLKGGETLMTTLAEGALRSLVVKRRGGTDPPKKNLSPGESSQGTLFDDGG